MMHSVLSPAPLTVPLASLAAFPAARAALPDPMTAARRPELASAATASVPVAAAPAAPTAVPPSLRDSCTITVDAYVPTRVRAHLEQTYYARVSAQATLAHLVRDAAFLDDPARHVALFSDHGIVHVRDVATRIVEVLDTMRGVCIPSRSRERLEGFMKSYGVLLAYLHDIGMADLSPRGRAAHAVVVAQLVFTPALDAVVEAVWAANSGGIAARLRDLGARGALTQEPLTVWREMLALAMAHSKSSVPRAVLDDPARLRRVMQQTLRADLWALYRNRDQRHETADGPVDLAALAMQRPRALRRFYADVEGETFGWLVCAHPAVRALVDDVLDTVRALRCADALRQRGTALKTSGAYEVFVEQATAQAVYALRSGPDRLFLLRLSDPLAAGEANLAHCWLSRAGDLHIAFQRGAFATPEAVERAAHDAAVVVDDIQSDVLGSLTWPRRRLRRNSGHRRSSRGSGHRDSGGDAGQRRGRRSTRWPVASRRLVLEGVVDNATFAALVRAQLLRRNPRLRGRVRITPAAAPAAAPTDGVGAETHGAGPPTDGVGMEEARYAAAPALDWDRAHCQAALERIAATGQRAPDGDPLAVFAGVKMVTLQPGETLVAAGTSAAFVYIPLAHGLSVLPVGGYAPATVGAWIPVGHTGVIRGAPRNATVVAERVLRLLMLPAAVYLSWWHHPYSAAELRARLSQLHGVTPERGTTGQETRPERGAGGLHVLSAEWQRDAVLPPGPRAGQCRLQGLMGWAGAGQGEVGCG